MVTAGDVLIVANVLSGSTSVFPAAMKGATSTVTTAKTTGALRQFVAACSASLTVMITGCWLGWPSPAIKRLLRNETDIVVTHEQISWIVACMDAGNIVSPIPSGYLMDIIGRKTIILISGVIFFFTWLMAGLAESPTLLYIARFFAGFGKGIGFTVAPMYLGEIASVRIRGALSTMFAGMIWAGTMFEFGVGPYVSFKTLIILSGIIPIIFIASFAFMPESPYYLVMKGRNEDARKALRWLRKAPPVQPGDDIETTPVEIELKEMRMAVAEEMKSSGKWSDLISSAGNRKATLIVMVTSAFQRLCGISPLLAYSSTTLPETNKFIGPNEIIVVFGIILTASNYIATPLVDKWGRKPLLVFSGACCGLTTGISAIFYYFHQKTEVDMSSWVWVPYVCICFFGLGHSVGVGVIPHTLLSELFPQNIKRYAASIASIVFALASFVINKLYATIATNIGHYAIFTFFSFNGLLCILFSYFVVFETKGKSFVEIQRHLHKE